MDKTIAHAAAMLMLTNDGAPEVHQVLVTFDDGQTFTGILSKWGRGEEVPNVTLHEAVVPNGRAPRLVTLDWDRVTKVEVTYSDRSTKQVP